MKFILFIATALSMNSAIAQTHCKAQFKRNLDEISKRAKSMKPACWREVQKGEGNSANIMSKCSDQEVNLAYAMEPFEKRNVALCQGPCAGELKAACVDGKSMNYYYSKVQ